MQCGKTLRIHFVINYTIFKKGVGKLERYPFPPNFMSYCHKLCGHFDELFAIMLQFSSSIEENVYDGSIHETK